MIKLLDNRYLDLIVNNSLLPFYDSGDNITWINERHSLVNLLPGQDGACEIGVKPYHLFPALFQPTSPVSLEAAGILALQQNPYLDLRGEGVLVGVIDTGIDYTHSAFMNPDQTTRIVSIWDQTETEGEPPEAFTFGTEYTSEMINLALASPEPHSLVPSSDPIGHGTSIASIIAGSPNPEQNASGVVPRAEFVIVRLKEAKENLRDLFFVPEDVICYQETDLMFGARYIYELSRRLRRPAVICVAMGSSQGGHDGYGALSRYLNYLSELTGIGVAIPAGNEGIAGRHYSHTVASEPYRNEFEFLADERDSSFSMEIWSSSHVRMAVSITAPNNESTQQVFPSFQECRQFQFIFHGCTIWINNIVFEQETGQQMILIRLKGVFPGVWSITVTGMEDEPFTFHAWLPSGAMISQGTRFLNPDPDTTITSPGNSVHPLTVTAYHQTDGKILQESGRGFTRTGRVKPDVAAPGYLLPCALPQNRYGALSGTGACAAFAAGAISMILEWAITKGNYTSLTGNDITQLIIRGARRSGDVMYPDPVWGYGQLDMAGVFELFTLL